MYSKSSPSNYGDVFRFMAFHSGPWVLLSGMSLAAIWKAAYGVWGWIDVLIIAVIISIRGVIEWILHMYIHHARPIPLLGFRIKTFIYSMHAQHHRNPDDLDSFLFGGKSLAGAIIVALAGFAIVPIPISIELSVLIGFLAAVLIQEIAHVICHSSIRPEWPFLKEIISLHRKHHNEDASKYMGVSSTLGDRLFKSMG